MGLVLFGAAFAAFSATNAFASESQLVGKWTEVNGQDKIAFTTQGTFTATMVYGVEGIVKTIVGKYFVDEDNISIQLNGDDRPMTWKFKFSGNYLIVTTSGRMRPLRAVTTGQ